MKLVTLALEIESRGLYSQIQSCACELLPDLKFLLPTKGVLLSRILSDCGGSLDGLTIDRQLKSLVLGVTLAACAV